MKIRVTPGKVPQVPLPGAVVHLFQDRLKLACQCAQSLIGQLPDCVSDAFGLQADADAVVIPDILFRQRPDPGALEGHRLHQALGLQIPDRLPNGALGNAQLLGPKGLDDLVPRVKLPGENSLPDGASDLLAEHLALGRRGVDSLHIEPPYK